MSHRVLVHSAEWGKHKYLYKDGDRYIYPEDLKRDRGEKVTIEPSTSNPTRRADNRDKVGYKTKSVKEPGARVHVSDTPVKVSTARADRRENATYKASPARDKGEPVQSPLNVPTVKGNRRELVNTPGPAQRERGEKVSVDTRGFASSIAKAQEGFKVLKKETAKAVETAIPKEVKPYLPSSTPDLQKQAESKPQRASEKEAEERAASAKRIADAEAVEEQYKKERAAVKKEQARKNKSDSLTKAFNNAKAKMFPELQERIARNQEVQRKSFADEDADLGVLKKQRDQKDEYDKMLAREAAEVASQKNERDRLHAGRPLAQLADVLSDSVDEGKKWLDSKLGKKRK